MAISCGDKRDLSVLNTFIFSTRTVKAVSVASPTFSNTFFVYSNEEEIDMRRQYEKGNN
jgi:hypothetical protein